MHVHLRMCQVYIRPHRVMPVLYSMETFLTSKHCYNSSVAADGTRGCGGGSGRRDLGRDVMQLRCRSSSLLPHASLMRSLKSYDPNTC